jgi:C4-dicarboxylate transporter DctM subunit
VAETADEFPLRANCADDLERTRCVANDRAKQNAMLTIVLLFVIMLLLIFLGVPLVYSIGAAAAAIILLQGDVNVSLVSDRMFKGVESFVLASIPFFLLAAEILTSGGLIERIIHFARLLIGHIRGGLAQTNILISMIFAGIQASCTADSAAIGGVLIPAMIKEDYDKDLSVVVTATSSCCGPIIPPSILMILYAFLTETSVAKLFLGGALPGLVLGLALMGITHYWVIKRGYRRSRSQMAPAGEIAKAGLVSSPALLVPLIIVGGLVGGLVTPTEAGVLACVAAILVSAFVYRELTLSKLVTSLKRAARTTAVIWAVIAVSTVFSEILVRNLFADTMIDLITFVSANPFVVLFMMTVFIFVLGMAIDTTPLLIMLAGPLHEAGMTVGIDPVHLGVVLVMAALIGTVSPPVSILLCLNCGIANIPLSETFGVIWSYLAVMMGVVVLCIFIPGIVMWLPNLIG